uniref:phage tail protein n=1 Tax=Agathobacter sp. TaxID=2021311 RepID=UPI0040573DC5
MAGASYSIKKNRIQRGYYPGFELLEDGTLCTVKEEPMHYLFLKAIDGAQEDSAWGRLAFQAEFPENMVCYIYVMAWNEAFFYRNGEPMRIEDFLCSSQESAEDKKKFMNQAGAFRFVNQKDILLYEQKGRYLYLMLEILGEGECSISHMRIHLQGDNFMNTFPEIYREWNGFFHRYLSIFSSIYNDFQIEIEDLPILLDLDCCPKELLPVYGKWMGIDTGNNFLDETILRPLIKEAYQLNRMKGTRKVLERIAEIVLGTNVPVLERNMMAGYIQKDQLEELERLYGDSIYDVTILVEQTISEVQKSQMLFLMEQFKPIRTRLHIVCLKKSGRLDSYSYLDMNARIAEQKTASLDGSHELDSMVHLE